MIVTVISFKGGVGKSTISQNLAVSLAHQRKDVCILDADGNESSSIWHRFRPDHLPAVDVFHVANAGDIGKAIKQLKRKYKYVIVDCPPAIERTTSYAVANSNLSLVPVSTTGGSDIWVTESFLEHLDLLRQKLNIKIPAYFIANRFEANVNMHKAYIRALKQFEQKFPIKLLDTKIAKRTAYGEANAAGQGVIEWDNAQAKREIEALTNEFLKLKSR